MDRCTADKPFLPEPDEDESSEHGAWGIALILAIVLIVWALQALAV